MTGRIPKSSWVRVQATLVCCLAAASVSAHIKNEASQFPDIEFSDARFDIVVLVGAGIIPETPVFEPDKVLSIQELATWAALAANLGKGGETPDVDALAEAALEQSLVESLQGDASFDDINSLFFDAVLTVDESLPAPTKADAATFIARQLNGEAGRALLERRGINLGDTGEITAIVAGKPHHGVTSYSITVGATTLPMDSHGRVANGPTDLLQWQGESVLRSFVRGEGSAAKWIYLEAAPTPVAEPVDTATPELQQPAPVQDRSLLYGLTAAVVVLGLILFFRRRRNG